MRPVRLCLSLLLLGTATRAQFDQFTWTLKGNPSGAGFVTSDVLHVIGPDGWSGCVLGSTTWLETVAPYPATISVLVDFTALDWPCDIFDAPACFLDGATCTPVQGFWCDDTYAFEFEVLAGQSFGFGIWSLDCVKGAGLGDFHDLVITPHEWLSVGDPMDPQIGPSVPGSAADRVGDVDGDGCGDYITGEASSATVRVRSGANGQVLHEKTGPGAFGKSVAGPGDLDGDGVSDFAAGAPKTSLFALPGEVYAWRGSDGAELFVATFAGATALGSEITGLGDVDGDGFADIAARSSASGEQLRVLGGPDGHLITTIGSTTPGQSFGVALAGPGDVDLDGVPDLLVGAPMALLAGPGHALLHSGASWTVLHDLVGSDDFGRGVSAAGDLDLDGTPDLLVSEESAPAGAVAAYSGATGLELFRTKGEPGAVLDAGVAGGSDLTGDGTPDFLTVTTAGPVVLQVRDGTGGAIVHTFASPTSPAAGEPVLLGNVDAVGTEDAALVAAGVHVFKALDGHGKPALLGSGTIAVNEPVAVDIVDGLPGGFALLVLGFTGLQVPMLGGVLQPVPEAALPLFLLQDGSLHLEARWPSDLPAYSTIWMQAWIMDPAGPSGWTCTNGLVATQVGG